MAAMVVVMIVPGVAAPEGAAQGSPNTRLFSNLSAETLACMTDRSRKQYGTVATVDSRNPNIVTSETHFFGVTRVVREFDPRGGKATFSILQKPAIASYDQVWNGIREAIKACS
jgi:hypothetical protein